MVSIIIDRASAPGYGTYADSGVYSLTQFSAAIDGVTDNGAKVRAAIAAVGTGDLYLPDGVAYCATDIPGIHELRLRGPGALRVGTGDPWYAEPTLLNTSTSSRMVLHVDPVDGDDTASGLAPEFGLKTLARAMEILANLPQAIEGHITVQIADGVLPAGAAPNLSSLRNRRVDIRGPAVAAWDNTQPPDDPVEIASITSADPPVLGTTTPHGRSNGDRVFIALAARSGGMHAADGQIYTVANATTSTFELSGVDGTGWAAYTGGGAVIDLGGNACPQTIVYGAGADVNGLLVDGDMAIRVYDIMFVGCGSLAGTQQSAALPAWNKARLERYNCWTLFNGGGNLDREGSVGITAGGFHFANYYWGRTIAARSTWGAANTTSTSDTTTPIVRGGKFGVEGWEEASGHIDGVHFDMTPSAWFPDGMTAIYLRRSSHWVELDCTFDNDGAARSGIIVDDGGYLNRYASSEVWNGSYTARVALRGTGRDIREDPTNDGMWRVARQSTGPAITAGAETTVITFPLEATQLWKFYQSFAMEFVAFGTWDDGAVILRLKLGSTTLYTLTLAADAAARQVAIDIKGRANGFGSMRMRVTGFDNKGGTVTPIGLAPAVSFDTSGGDTTLSLTVEVVSATDTLTVTGAELDLFGL